MTLPIPLPTSLPLSASPPLCSPGEVVGRVEDSSSSLFQPLVAASARVITSTGSSLGCFIATDVLFAALWRRGRLFFGDVDYHGWRRSLIGNRYTYVVRGDTFILGRLVNYVASFSIVRLDGMSCEKVRYDCVL